MPLVKRSPENPILLPDPKSAWEAAAAYNPCAVESDGVIHLLYRATGAKQKVGGVDVEVSTIGHATSKDGINFKGREQLFAPQYDWERYGCEDPRATTFEGKHYIFYTAVREFSADGIKVAVAITKDCKKIDEKHLVTPFNAKAMALFPERVNGKIAAVLTVNTDRPPAKICLALFDRIEDLWSEEYWNKWYADWKSHVIAIDQNDEKDQIEVGSTRREDQGRLAYVLFLHL